MAADLIEVGYNAEYNKDREGDCQHTSEPPELVDKHTEYLLKIMALVSDIYRCTRNSKSKYHEKDCESDIRKIESNIRQFFNRINM